MADYPPAGEDMASRFAKYTTLPRRFVPMVGGWLPLRLPTRPPRYCKLILFRFFFVPRQVLPTEALVAKIIAVLVSAPPRTTPAISLSKPRFPSLPALLVWMDQGGHGVDAGLCFVFRGGAAPPSVNPLTIPRP